MALLSFVGASTLAEIHEATVLHVACAEHGGQIEDVGPLGLLSSSRVATVQSAPPDAGAHHACELPPSLSNGALTWHAVAWTLVPPLPLVVDASAPEGAPGRTGPPLLSLAPKLSPPRT